MDEKIVDPSHTHADDALTPGKSKGKRRTNAEIRAELKAEILAEMTAKADAVGAAIDSLPPVKSTLLENFTVNLPAHANSIRVNGRDYFHGMTYKLKPDQVASMADIQGMAWRHDQEVAGQRRPNDAYRLRTNF